jgi:hypothetical protein
MQPLSILTGIILGSVASIAFGLAVSVLVSVIIGRDAPQLAAELGALWKHTLVFTALTAVCAMGFLGLIKGTRWRWYAQCAMWVALAAVVYAYWPR